MQLVGSPLESVTAEHLDRVWPDTGPTVDCLVAHCGERRAESLTGRLLPTTTRPPIGSSA